MALTLLLTLKFINQLFVSNSPLQIASQFSGHTCTNFSNKIVVNRVTIVNVNLLVLCKKNAQG